MSVFCRVSIFENSILAKHFQLLLVQVVRVKQTLFPTDVVSMRVRFTELVGTEIQSLARVGCGFRV